MKKRKIFLIVLCTLAFITGAVLMVKFLFMHPKSVTFSSCPTEITYTGFHPGNNRQRTASVWLGCYNQQLYYFGGGKSSTNKTEYDDSLFVFQEGNLVEVAPLSRGKNTISILGIVDNYIYYREASRGDYTKYKLYSYNLESKEESLLYCGDLRWTSSMFFANDGSVYFQLRPVRGETTQFVHVLGQTVLGVEPLTEGYPLGESVYYVVSEYHDVQVERILKTDADGNIELEEIPFEQAYNRSVIPYEDGLLVHNERLNSLLYRIDEDGSVTELFNVPCMASESAVNIHETDAYISVVRYEKYGEKGMLRYENDSLEGTYRISLIDGSIEKISDMCFDGLYNFDDTCFYCCDKQGNIYKMEFDGTISPILLLSEDD